MGSKIVPSWPQERPGSGAKAIFAGLEIEQCLKTIRPPTTDWARDLYPPKLGLWEEGREEGKPSTHIVVIVNYRFIDHIQALGHLSPPVAGGIKVAY